MWARSNANTTFSAGAPFVPFQADLLTNFAARYGADPLGVTITRIRGIMGMYVGPPGTAIQLGRVGIRVGAEGEVASTEFNPSTNGEYLDWMSFEPFYVIPAGTATDSVEGTNVCARVVDVKSSRKLEELDQSLFLYAGITGATIQAVTLFYDLSIGLMLP